MSILLRRRFMGGITVSPREDDDPIILVGSVTNYDGTDRRRGIYAFGWDLSDQRHHYYAENTHDVSAFAYNNNASFFASRPAHVYARTDIRRNTSYSVGNWTNVAEAATHQQSILNQDGKYFVRPKSSVDSRQVRVFNDTDPFTEISGYPQVPVGFMIHQYIENPWDSNIVGVVAYDDNQYVRVFILNVSLKTFDKTLTPSVNLNYTNGTGFFRHSGTDKEFYFVSGNSHRGWNYETETEITWSGLQGRNCSSINYNKTLLALGHLDAGGVCYNIYVLSSKSKFSELPALSGSVGNVVKWLSNSDLLIGTSAGTGANGLYHFDVWNFELVSHTNYASNVVSIDCPVPADPPSSPPVDHTGIYASSDFLTMDMIN